MSDDRLMLLDTAALYFRAFYGLPATLKSPDGTPVNAVRGLLDMIGRLVTDFRPAALIACWDDDWRPQWRVDLIPSYKAHRVGLPGEGGPDVETVPDPLTVQVPIIVEALTALGRAATTRCALYDGSRSTRHCGRQSSSQQQTRSVGWYSPTRRAFMSRSPRTALTGVPSGAEISGTPKNARKYIDAVSRSMSRPGSAPFRACVVVTPGIVPERALSFGL